jgi:hypothetical protein
VKPGVKRGLLVAALLLGSFQLGRLSERAVLPCRLRPLAGLVAPLLGREIPSREVCDLILRIPHL